MGTMSNPCSAPADAHQPPKEMAAKRSARARITGTRTKSGVSLEGTSRLRSRAVSSSPDYQEVHCLGRRSDSQALLERDTHFRASSQKVPTKDNGRTSSQSLHAGGAAFRATWTPGTNATAPTKSRGTPSASTRMSSSMPPASSGTSGEALVSPLRPWLRTTWGASSRQVTLPRTSTAAMWLPGARPRNHWRGMLRWAPCQSPGWSSRRSFPPSWWSTSG